MNNRDKIKRKLQESGIQTGIHYPVPIHKHKCFEGEAFASDKTFPHSEKLSSELLSLPMHPNLSLEEVIYISQKLKESLSESSNDK